MKKKLCVKCHKEVDILDVVCECGNQYFIIGENFNNNKGEVKCNCGGDFNNGVVVEDCEHLIAKEYNCYKCNNKVLLEKNIGTLVSVLKLIDQEGLKNII